jgi:hypothetical protein
MSRFDMDVFIVMAEHVALRGLDDASADTHQHYLERLPESVQNEPFGGFSPPRSRHSSSHLMHVPYRRIECMALAHKELRERLEQQLKGMLGRESTSEEDLRQAQAALERIGKYPCWMSPNSDEAWHEMQQCVCLRSFLLDIKSSTQGPYKPENSTMRNMICSGGS